MSEDMKILEVLAHPIVDYLRERYNPHTTIVITDNRVVMVEDVVSVPLHFED